MIFFKFLFFILFFIHTGNYSKCYTQNNFISPKPIKIHRNIVELDRNKNRGIYNRRISENIYP